MTTTKIKYSFLIFLALTIILCSCGENPKIKKHDLDFSKSGNFTIRQEINRYFDNCGVVGAFVLFDNQKKHWILSDTVETNFATLPASSFKIINLLIALETKTIKDENETIKWIGTTDTIRYGFRPEIYNDLTVKEAFELSAGWVFVELAKKIGRNNYKKYLSDCKYGNLDLSQNDTDFWNFGDFAVSSINQVEFIRNLYDEKLPFTKRNIEIVKRVMITEQNEQYTIRAKTGWTRENEINTGWWVGYIENKDRVYFFATRLLQDRKIRRDDFGTCRKEITMQVLRELNIIE
jgi:beta-lactamase class D